MLINQMLLSYFRWLIFIICVQSPQRGLKKRNVEKHMQYQVLLTSVHFFRRSYTTIDLRLDFGLENDK